MTPSSDWELRARQRLAEQRMAVAAYLLSVTRLVEEELGARHDEAASDAVWIESAKRA